VTAADEQDRAQVGELARRVQAETGETDEIAFVDQGYTGENAAEAAQEHGIKLEVEKLLTAKRDSSCPSAVGGGAKLLAGCHAFAAWHETMSDYR
jgi:hypothetical protein